MSKKKMSKEAPKETKKITAKSDVKKAAVKAEPVKVPEVTEVPIPEPPKFIPIAMPDACQFAVTEIAKGNYALYNPNHGACNTDCKKDFLTTHDACMKNTEAYKTFMAATSKKAPKGTRKGFVRKGEKTPFGWDVNSGAGKIDLLLLSKEGATMEQMKALRGAVSSHLNSLKKMGVVITQKEGKYFGSLPQ